jgi:hypothetical protein
MQHQKPLMIHQYQMQQVEEKNLQQTSHEEIQLLQLWILVASCKLATDQRNTWVIKAKSPTSTICLSNDHEHTHN